MKDWESDSSIHFDSDHIPIRIKLQVKLAAKVDEKQEDAKNARLEHKKISSNLMMSSAT